MQKGRQKKAQKNAFQMHEKVQCEACGLLLVVDEDPFMECSGCESLYCADCYEHTDEEWLICVGCAFLCPKCQIVKNGRAYCMVCEMEGFEIS